MILKSYAKLNLYLKVQSQRKDKFHNLITLFERINLADKITLKIRNDGLITVSCDNKEVPGDKTNLCYRAARLLRENCRVKRGVDVRILKNIPVGAGLGGGSSNAAATLMGLNKLWKLNLNLSRLVTLAKQIGCDVPFFIYNAPFALGSCRGDKIKPIESLKRIKLWHLLVVPKIHVSTLLIYNKFDQLSGLTNSPGDVKILSSDWGKRPFSPGSLILYNSLQQVTVKEYPEVGRIIRKLASLRQKSVLMSGSGPAVFAVLSLRKEALSLKKQLKFLKNDWQVFVVKTI